MKNICNVVKKPCLTEKGMTLQEVHNQVVVKVDTQANKIEIKEAVEQMFKVKVDKVRTANMHGKSKRVGRHSGRRNDWKKAIVTLAEGHKINFLEDL
ncbi:MAG: 50S ribosomal protein L23 [Proteobacteria bacterium]|nr:50S ribosomal protein L23 [Pseudomonadota bacterium]MBU1738282.1 50S ribosomal protein L23 [Pseudomonadota bacterium]